MQLSSRLPSRYILDTPLGKGGFGEVHKAYDTKLGKNVAIKILSHISTANKASIKREFEVLSQLTHPHLVKVYNFGFISEHIPYFTMEYIEGNNLKAFLAIPAACNYVPNIIFQILEALGYLHDNNIIHGDIKPENIIISNFNDSVTTKILDFGLSSTITDISTQISGTPRFIAPEVFYKQSQSSASDLYSLGMTLIESFTGKEVPGSTEINTSYYKNTHSALSSLLISHGILNPSAIASFILDLCERDPANRPDTALTALQRFKVIVDISPQDIAHRIDEIFIGRNHELSLINEFIHRNNIDTRIIILKGPTGMGKKALMRKTIYLAQPEGYFVLDLSDPSFIHNTIERIIETISNNLKPSKRDVFLERHKKILNLVKARTDSEKSLSKNIRVAYSNIIDYLRALADNGPIMLCIPDIERFSEDFYQFFDQLIHELHLPETDIRLITSFNTDKPLAKVLSDTFQRSSSLGYSRIIDIQPFTQKELNNLQLTLFNRVIFNKHQTQHIIKETEGTPLLILEYFKHLIANNTIQFENGIWTLDYTLFTEMPIPGAITEFIEEEYSNLNQISKNILQIMAIWERGISRDTLSELTNININDLSYYITQLIESMIIENREINSYGFKHDAYIKYIKKRTSRDKSKRINTSILNYLEQSSSTDYERLAIHSLNTDSIDTSIKYVFLAVDLLEKRLEYHRCYELLIQLKALLSKLGHEENILTVLDRLAPIELLIGDFHNALHDYELLFDSTTDNALKAIYSKWIFNIHYAYFGDLNTASKYLNIAMSYADKSNDNRIKADILLDSSMINRENREELRKKASALVKNIDINLYVKISSFLSISYMQAGKHDEAIALIEELYSLLTEISPSYKKYIYTGLYNTTFYTGEYDKSKLYTEESIKINQELCDEINLIENYNNLGGLYYIKGLFYDQIKVLTILLSKLKKYNTFDCSFYLGNLSLAYRSIADYRNAYKALEQATFYYNDLIGKHATTWTLSKYNYYYALMGDWGNENYRKYLQKTSTSATRSNNIIAIGHTKLVNAFYYYQRIQIAYAIRNVNAALSIFRKAKDRDDIVDSLRLLTMILIEKGELDKAQEAIIEAREIFNEIHCDYLKPQLLLAEGALARAQNSPDAGSKLEEALKTSKKMFTREYTWQIQRELALHNKNKGELHKALQYYRNAIDMIKEITETIDGDEVKTSYLALPFRKRVFDEIKQLKRDIAGK